jgi:hypothetical protein
MIERKTNLGKVLEGKFISQVLEEEGQDINSEIDSNMSGFSNQTNRGRSFVVKDKTLLYTFPLTNRFIDMKSRQTNKGMIKKKNYKVHNTILFGYANNIIGRLSYGFTQETKEEIMKLHNLKI